MKASGCSGGMPEPGNPQDANSLTPEVRGLVHEVALNCWAQWQTARCRSTRTKMLAQAPGAVQSPLLAPVPHSASPMLQFRLRQSVRPPLLRVSPRPLPLLTSNACIAATTRKPAATSSAAGKQKPWRVNSPRTLSSRRCAVVRSLTAVHSCLPGCGPLRATRCWATCASKAAAWAVMMRRHRRPWILTP